ncbi:hypothetical protein TrVFT333_008077 [Trichoderma virens FT-333]|nr:hypothetical protein TrVFT333_008077 [Trichoderma virens FT-333]
MENQIPQDGQPSRGSSISLDDEIGLISREVYGPVTSGLFLMMPLDLPNTYTVEDPFAGTLPSDDGAESSSLSVLRLERYLAEEHYHERFPLGMHPLGINKATVRRYLPGIIQNVESDASQAEATRGTVTDCDDRGCQGSTTTTATSTPSDASPEPIRAHDINDAASALLTLTPFSSHDMAPSLAGLSQTDVALVKPKDAPASNESHPINSETFDEDLEMGHILMRRRVRGCDRHSKWRVGKQPRIHKSVRRRKRTPELPESK